MDLVTATVCLWLRGKSALTGEPAETTRSDVLKGIYPIDVTVTENAGTGIGVCPR